MSDHQIIDVATYNFELWRGDPPPPYIQEEVSLHTRPGADGVAVQKLGQQGRPLVAQLVSHWASYAAAVAIVDDYLALAGKGLVIVVYNTINWNTTYSIKFYVERVKFLNAQARPLLVGPGYSYANGAELLTEWTLIPSDVS